MKPVHQYILFVSILLGLGVALNVYKDDIQAYLEAEIAPEAVDITGVWKTDDTIYVVEHYERRPAGIRYPAGHDHWLKRQGINTLVLSHMVDEGYVFGTFQWSAGAPDKEKIYGGVFDMLGAFEKHADGGEEKKLMMVSNRPESSGAKLMMRLNMIDKDTMHGIMFSIEGIHLNMHQTYRRQPTTNHVLDIRDEAMAEHTVFEARTGDKITLRVAETVRLYIIEMGGIGDAYLEQKDNLLRDEKGEVSWIARHPGTVRIGCEAMPDFELIVNVTG